MTQYPDLFAALAAPFARDEVKTRQQGGRTLYYVTARTVMNRLDNVLGPESWWDAYPVVGEHSVLCALTIRLPDGSTLTKHDAGGCAGMSDPGDDDKSAVSDGFKRAAVKFGIGRYLYADGVPSYGPEITPRAAHVELDVAPPSAPANGHANGHAKRESRWGNRRTTPAATNGTATLDRPACPSNGKALYGWCKDQEQRHQVGLIKYLNSWATLQEFPGRMVDWSLDQVALAHAEALRKLERAESQEPLE